MPIRCWPTADPLMIAYHDEEWGVPVHGARPLFAKLTLDGFQAGLSWAIILRKRAAFLAAFDGFDPERMARYDARRVARLLADPGIVRNRLKVAAAIGNARALIAFEGSGGDFDALLWSFVDGRPKLNAWRTPAELPAATAESRRMSDALLELGFRFVGPTICYAFMQAVGMVNDHLVGCGRHRALAGPAGRRRAPRRGARAP